MLGELELGSGPKTQIWTSTTQPSNCRVAKDPSSVHPSKRRWRRPSRKTRTPSILSSRAGARRWTHLGVSSTMVLAGTRVRVLWPAGTCTFLCAACIMCTCVGAVSVYALRGVVGSCIWSGPTYFGPSWGVSVGGGISNLQAATNRGQQIPVCHSYLSLLFVTGVGGRGAYLHP